MKLIDGKILDENLKKEICARLRKKATARHVPSKIVQVKDIPYTINMKKVELAVKHVITGTEVTNRDALSNPECLEEYRNIEELERD